jgi:hypothetical protein
VTAALDLKASEARIKEFGKYSTLRRKVDLLAKLWSVVPESYWTILDPTHHLGSE